MIFIVIYLLKIIMKNQTIDFSKNQRILSSMSKELKTLFLSILNIIFLIRELLKIPILPI